MRSSSLSGSAKCPLSSVELEQTVSIRKVGGSNPPGDANDCGLRIIFEYV